MTARPAIAGLVLSSLLGALLVAPVSAQGFNRVYSKDGYDVWAVGNAGTVYRSLNGGASWASYPLGTANHRGVAARGTRVWIVDDAGSLWASKDHGHSFNASVPAAGTPFYAVTFADDQTGWIAGALGTILKTTDGGGTWAPQTSGTTASILALRFHGALEGWGCGTDGTVLHTTDGGSSWAAMTPFAFREDLCDVDFREDTVYVGGTYGFLAKSENGGASWSLLDLKITSKSDVYGVELRPGGTLWLCGGGGFLRKSVDGGQSYTYPLHPIMSPITDVYFSDANRGWACARGSRVVARTRDGGRSWSVPGGGGFLYTWTLKVSNGGTSVRGNTLRIDPFNRDKLYAVQGKSVIASWDRGETWRPIATIPGIGTRTNAFLVSPTDTNTWLAITQDDDRVSRTTDGGVTWSVPLRLPFTEYGVPMDQDDNVPTTVYFGPDDGKFWMSTDFGATWAVVSTPGFRNPMDISAVSDTTGVIYLSDGVTGVGQAVIWKTSDGGLTWTVKQVTAGSEVPMIAVSRLDKWVSFATAWSSGGVLRTTDMGETWPQVRQTYSEWGADFAKDDPNVALTATYSGNSSFITIDRGQTWILNGDVLLGSNYGALAYDRSTLFVHQSGGVYKAVITQPDMPVDNAEVLALQAPNGGEEWQYDSRPAVAWLSQNFPEIKIEFQSDPLAPWQTLVATAPAPANYWYWTIPNLPTSEARIRVSDAYDGTPMDESDDPFSIVVPAVVSSRTDLDFVQVPIGWSATDTLSLVNNGTATLVVSSVSVAGGGPFTPTRTSFSIPPGGADTLAVIFEPIAVGSYDDTLVIASNAPDSPTRVILAGKGTAPTGVPAADLGPPVRFDLRASVPNPFGAGGTVISYALPRECDVSLVVYNVLGQAVAKLVRGRQRAGTYAIRFPSAALTYTVGLGSALPSGVYFYRLRAGEFSATRRMVLVR